MGSKVSLGSPLKLLNGALSWDKWIFSFGIPECMELPTQVADLTGRGQAPLQGRFRPWRPRALGRQDRACASNLWARSKRKKTEKEPSYIFPSKFTR